MRWYHQKEADILLLGQDAYLALNAENAVRWPRQWRRKNQERRQLIIKIRALEALIGRRRT